MASGDDHGFGSHGVQFGGGGFHVVKVADFDSGEGFGFVDVGGDYVGQGYQPLDQQSSSGGIQKIRSGGGLEDGVEDDIGQARHFPPSSPIGFLRSPRGNLRPL